MLITRSMSSMHASGSVGQKLLFQIGRKTSQTTKASCRQAHSKGLFSINGLNNPDDFMKLASAAMADCDSLRQTLAAEIDQPIETIHRASEVLFQLDSISRHVCNVIDAAELCRCVHSSAKWRESAGAAFTALSDYIAQLNADTNLYLALTKITATNIFQNLSEEQRRFALLLKAEFETDGIHLPDDQREHVRNLQSKIVELETLFQENITHSRKYFDVEASWVEPIIPRHILEAHVPQSGRDGKVTLSSDAQISNTLGRFAANPLLREQVYMETMTSCPENIEVLKALQKVRHESAVAQGFQSYAERFLKDKMAKNPRNVNDFLDKLQRRIAPLYKRDMDEISEAKRMVERVQDGTIQPWDIPFYSGVLKARDGFDPNQVAPYFTIANCIEGMKILVKNLFGITMQEEAMEEGERWDEGVPLKAQARKFVFVDESESPLGTVYLDLHPREGKYVHAAHFTVLCGCVKSLDAATFQLPVVALVCNMSDSSVISHSEVETLFHEFGHVLHSLLSRTTFQHLSGTRAALDFVETPSHLIENFAWDPHFLNQFAQHYQTGAAIPDELMHHLVRSRSQFKSIDVQNQILYSRLDQCLFGEPTDRETTEIFADLYRSNSVPFAPGTHWYTRFGHLVTYGAGYYSYLYANVFSNDIWRERFQPASLSRQSGHRLWDDMLGKGGAVEPSEMLKTVLGRDPSVNSFFDRMDL